MAAVRTLAFVGGALPRLGRGVTPMSSSACRAAAAVWVRPAPAAAAGMRMATSGPASGASVSSASTGAVASPPARVVSEPSPSTAPDSAAAAAPPAWKVKLLYDGECPLCVREVNFLKKKDDGRGVVAFVDIADPAYAPADNADVDYATAMGRIHAIEADGTVLQDVAVFRRVYEELGMGWVYAATKVKAVESVANSVYGVWARGRLALTGRGSMEEVVKAREDCKDTCRI